MPINIETDWTDHDNATRHKLVYRGRNLIGRVNEHLDQDGHDFSADRIADGFFVPIEGRYPTFEAALERLIFYGVFH